MNHAYCPFCEYRAHSSYERQSELALADHILSEHGRDALNCVTLNSSGVTLQLSRMTPKD